MKILHIYKTSYPDTFGGVEHYISSLTEATTRLGMDNTILTIANNSSGSNNDNPIPIVREKKSFELASCPFSFSMAAKFRKFIEPYDVLHLHFPWPFGEFLSTFLAPHNKKICVTYHSDIVRQKFLKACYQPLMQKFLKRCDRIIVTSPNLLNSSPDLKNFKNKCELIALGINPENYHSDAQKIQQWKATIGENFLLFIGQFRYYKGLHVLLTALKNTSIPTVIVGGGYLEKELRAQAEKIHLPQVTFTGPLANADKMALLALSKALVLPSIHKSEAFGIVLLEAAAFKKPLISTELGTGTSFANAHYETGLVVSPNNVEELSVAIKKIFQDNVLAHTMGEAAYMRLNKLFHIDKIAQEHVALYKDL